MKRSKKQKTVRAPVLRARADATSGPVRLFLDDMRKAPPGWRLVKTAAECIEVLDRERANVVELSLDHDLLPEHYDTNHGPTAYRTTTGMAVVDWMIANSVWPAVVHVHSLSDRRHYMTGVLVDAAPEGTTIHMKPRLV